VSKDNLEPPSPDPTVPAGQPLSGLYVCYKLKCPKVDIQHTVEDQFDDREMSFKSSKLLCAPAQQSDSLTTASRGVVTH
jgi:hypothetical protein